MLHATSTHALHTLQIHTKGRGRSQGPVAANEKHEITSGSPGAESWPERQRGDTTLYTHNSYSTHTESIRELVLFKMGKCDTPPPEPIKSSLLNSDLPWYRQDSAQSLSWTAGRKCFSLSNAGKEDEECRQPGCILKEKETQQALKSQTL